MANISYIKTPDNTTYTIHDPKARPLTNNDFDTINVTELNAGDLIVTGVGRFTNGLYGNLIGNASTATLATTASKLSNTSKVGDTNKPVYFTASGVPSAVSYTLGAACEKGVDTTVTSGSSNLVTSGAVYTAIDNLPEPMVFKGTLGTGGTITSLPTAAAANEGFTYKVITAGTYASQTAKVGDVFVSNGSSWVLIPSGDTDSDTWRSIKVNGTEKLTSAISSGAVDFVNGTNTTVNFNTTGSKISINSVNTTYSLSASGESVVLSGSDSSSKSVSLSTLINGLSTGSSTPVDNDYYVSQYVNGGTTTTSYHRRPMSALWTYIKGKADSIYLPTTTKYAGSSSVGGAATSLAGFTNTTTTATAVDSATQNGHVYVNGTSDIYGISDGGCFVQAYSTSWVGQIYQDYRTGQIALRGKNNGTWQSWRKVLDSSNYTTYTLPVTNNAGFHNSIYRGKSLGTSITTAQWNSISAGTFDDMYIGDYWTLSTTIGSTTSNIQYVIAGFDYWWNCGDSYPQSSNKHHVVLVPAGNLYSAQMNATNITTGGYIGSAMYTTNLENARTGISTLFGDHLYSVRRLFTNSVNTVGQATGWVWATSSVDLMSETMVYGHPVWTTSGFEVGVDRTILPLFALNPASASTRSNWWLRSVAAPSHFALVDISGNAYYYNDSYSYGVRPAFAIY